MPIGENHLKQPAKRFVLDPGCHIHFLSKCGGNVENVEAKAYSGARLSKASSDDGNMNQVLQHPQK